MNWYVKAAHAAIGIIVLGLTACSAHRSATSTSPTPVVEPSSAIPARREFPIRTDVSPCADFYENACGAAIAGFRLREDRSRHIFAFDDSRERLLEAKKSYLRSLLEKRTLKPGREQSLARLYGSCMNTPARIAEERDWVRRLTAEVEQIETREAFIRYLASKLLTPDSAWIEIAHLPSLERPDRWDVALFSSLMTLPERSYYGRPEVLADEMKLVADFFREIGLSGGEQRATAVVSFEKDFSEHYPLPNDFRNRYSRPSGISRKELTSRFPRLALRRVLSQIPPGTHIRDLIPETLAFLERSLAQRPLHELKSVYLFHALSQFMDEAYPEFYAKKFEFRKRHLGGPNERPVREERCTDWVVSRFGKELDAELLPKLFPTFPESRFVALADRVRQAILDGLRSNEWLTDSAREIAMQKVRVANLQLVKPRNAREWDFNLPARFFPDRYIENHRRLVAGVQKKMLRDLARPRDRARWSMTPLTVNAYYSASDNKFVMPIGILQYPFFDPALSDEANLGAVGAVIGHELGHGIDDKGSRYDELGRLRQWMTAADLGEFERRTQLLVKQFDQIGHNGALTLGENIGDLVGVTFALRAAFAGREPSPSEARDFFYQYARVWCAVARPKYAELLLKIDPHANPKARVNEQVKHQPLFERAFACRSGDPMTLPAAERVRVW